MRARMAIILGSKECELREILLKDKPRPNVSSFFQRAQSQ